MTGCCGSGLDRNRGWTEQGGHLARAENKAITHLGEEQLILTEIVSLRLNLYSSESDFVLGLNLSLSSSSQNRQGLTDVEAGDGDDSTGGFYG